MRDPTINNYGMSVMQGMLVAAVLGSGGLGAGLGIAALLGNKADVISPKPATEIIERFKQVDVEVIPP